MGLFNHHTKALQEATNNARPHPSEATAKDAEVETLKPSTYPPVGALTDKDPASRMLTQLPESSNTAPIQREASSWSAGPAHETSCGNENITASGAPVSDGLVHENATEQKQEHHFWGKRHFGGKHHLGGKDRKDQAKVPAVQGHKRVSAASGGQKGGAAWPERGDPLGDGNLGQGLTWR